jgi:hypothetical protein
MLQRVATSGLEHRHRVFLTHNLYASTPMKRIRNRLSHSIQSIVCIPHSPHSMHLFCIVKEMRAMDFLIASGSGGERWQGLDRAVHRSTWWPCGRRQRLRCRPLNAVEFGGSRSSLPTACESWAKEILNGLDAAGSDQKRILYLDSRQTKNIVGLCWLSCIL